MDVTEIIKLRSKAIGAATIEELRDVLIVIIEELYRLEREKMDKQH